MAAPSEGMGGVSGPHYLGGDQFRRSRSPVYQWLRGTHGFLLSKLIGECGINLHHSNLICVVSWEWSMGCSMLHHGVQRGGGNLLKMQILIQQTWGGA